MSVIGFSQYGTLDLTKRFSGMFEKMKRDRIEKTLRRLGDDGVEALKKATPKRTGKTSESWSYDIEFQNDKVIVSWKNSNVVNDWANVAILIQEGHATRNGGYVMGIDYINPALKPIFEQISNEMWKAVTTS